MVGLPGDESACNAGDLSSVPVRKIPWRRKQQYSCLLQNSCLENSMDRGAWQSTVHVVAKSWTQLSNLHFTSQYDSF